MNFVFYTPTETDWQVGLIILTLTFSVIAGKIIWDLYA
jgi:hypothetical protein|tara:strand:+ start:324 stop:437 length:114 start_codon:yes stop_codon:yes gene_type:complete